MCCPASGGEYCGSGGVFSVGAVNSGRFGIDCLFCSITGCPALLLYIHFRAFASTLASKVGTVCGSSASTGLFGGWWVTAIPTATQSGFLSLCD